MVVHRWSGRGGHVEENQPDSLKDPQGEQSQTAAHTESESMDSSDGLESLPASDGSLEPDLPVESEPIIGPSMIILIANDGREPKVHGPESDACSLWIAVSAPWHPVLLSHFGALPRYDSASDAHAPRPGDVVAFPSGASAMLPSGFRTQAEDTGAILIDLHDAADRSAVISELIERIVPGEASPKPDVESLESEAESLIRDFLALGTARWWLRELTSAMSHGDTLDEEGLKRESLAAAGAWRERDWNTARNHLRAAFELLTEARERFFPVESYLVDLCLLDPTTPPESLDVALSAHRPITFIAPARAIETLADRAPERLETLRRGIEEGWIDVVGGSYEESDEPLLPLESVLWQFRHAATVYRAHLNSRTVESVARRRFALYPQLPQLARRHGIRFGVHLAFDAGRFPVRPEAKRLWDSPDGSNLEALTRPPLAADAFHAFRVLPWSLGRSMQHDHVATISLAHWPQPVSAWHEDLQRMLSYAAVLARAVNLGEYFQLTDRPFESFRPALDDYGTPYLAEAVTRGDSSPVARRARHARLRARLDELTWLRAFASCLVSARPDLPPGSLELIELEQLLEGNRLDDTEGQLELQRSAWGAALAESIVGSGHDRPAGFLVLNPTNSPRRQAVLLPGAEPGLSPQGGLRATQPAADGIWAVVDLPAHGYTWVPAANDPKSATTSNTKVLSARGRILRNDSIEVEIDSVTGGVRSLKGLNEINARIGQQLVIHGLANPDGKPILSKMVESSFTVESSGPVFVRAVSKGSIQYQPAGSAQIKTLALFEQVYTLWSGRAVLDIECRLSDLDPQWLVPLTTADPWTSYLASRWAWLDEFSTLRRTQFLGMYPTEAHRPETPDAFEIVSKGKRTTILMGGLAHHQRQGKRMLDTLLITGRETERVFRLQIALDKEHAHLAAIESITAPLVIPTASGPPAAGPTGWLLSLDNRAVAVTRVEAVDDSGGGRGWGIAIHVLETSGHPARCRMRLYRNPVWARQTDYNDQILIDLPTDGDAVLLDLTPHEMARVDVTLG